MFTKILLDIDTDSENYYTIAMNNITMRYGKEFTFDVKSKKEFSFYYLILSDLRAAYGHNCEARG